MKFWNIDSYTFSEKGLLIRNPILKNETLIKREDLVSVNLIDGKYIRLKTKSNHLIDIGNNIAGYNGFLHDLALFFDKRSFSEDILKRKELQKPNALVLLFVQVLLISLAIIIHFKVSAFYLLIPMGATFIISRTKMKDIFDKYTRPLLILTYTEFGLIVFVLIVLYLILFLNKF